MRGKRRRARRRFWTGTFGLLLLAAGISGFFLLREWNFAGWTAGVGIAGAAEASGGAPSETPDATFAGGEPGDSGSGAHTGGGSSDSGTGTNAGGGSDGTGTGTNAGGGSDGSGTGTNAGHTPPPKESVPPSSEPSKPAKPGPDDQRKLIALTFDDGPDHKYTPQILDILKEYDAKATFFLVGTQVEKYPDTAKRIVEEGHSIGNHSWSHEDLTKLSAKAAARQIAKAQQAIVEATGTAPRLLRAPYGAISEDVLKTAHDSDLLHVAWTVDTKDWAGSSVADMYKNVMDNSRDGGVVLMHSFGGRKNALEHTVKLLPSIIKDLRDQGYELVTVDELIDSGHYRSSVIK